MEIVSGINSRCKNAQGGVKKLWLMPYIKYSRSQIVLNGNILTSFPSSTLYEFESIGDVSFDENMQENEGGKFFNIAFQIRTDKDAEVRNFLKFDFRAVGLDRLGNYRLLGTYNGLTCTSINKVSGSGKSDFNGFNLSFEGQEEKEAPYFYDLNVITGAGGEFLLQENGSFILQENGFKILL